MSSRSKLHLHRILLHSLSHQPPPLISSIVVPLIIPMSLHDVGRDVSSTFTMQYSRSASHSVSLLSSPASLNVVDSLSSVFILLCLMCPKHHHLLTSILWSNHNLLRCPLCLYSPWSLLLLLCPVMLWC